MTTQIVTRSPVPPTIRPRNHLTVGAPDVAIDDSGVQRSGRHWSRGRHDDSMRLCLGALYPCPETVRAILAPTTGAKKRILDIGCGTGAWCLAMANEFPQAAVLGIERLINGCRTWDHDDIPANCNFETRSDYEFLASPDFKDRFDVIHMRFVAGGCTQFVNTMDNVQMCLKPGGIFILIDATGEIFAEDGLGLVRMKSRRHPEGSRLRRLFYEVYNVNVHQGFDENMMLATLNEGFWEFSELVDCKAAELLVPIGAWATSTDADEEHDLKQAGHIMQQLLQAILPGHEKILKEVDFDDRVLNKWHDEIRQELQNEATKMSLDIRLLWGRRKGGEPLPIDGVTATLDHSYLRVCDHPDTWREMLESRNFLGHGAHEHIEAFVHKIHQSPISPTHQNDHGRRRRLT